MTHSLREPERHGEPAAAPAVCLVTPVGDVEHEHVHEFVVDHVHETLGVAGVGQHHALAKGLGKPPGPLADQAVRDVGLLEVVGRRIEDERDLGLELVVEDPRQPEVGVLGDHGRARCELLLLRVEEDLEVRGVQDVPVEVLVLDLVAAEELRLGQRRQEDPEQDERGRGIAHGDGNDTTHVLQGWPADWPVRRRSARRRPWCSC